MDELALKDRFRHFALRIVKLVDSMSNQISQVAIAKQIVRSGTSCGANYRAACLAKSDKDFLNKLKIVQEEIDETNYWLSLIIDSEMFPKNKVQNLYDESLELLRIINKSIITVNKRLDKENRDKLRDRSTYKNSTDD